MTTPEPDIGISYLLDLDLLDGTTATFQAGVPQTTLIMSRDRWEALHRPGTLRVDVSPR